VAGLLPAVLVPWPLMKQVVVARAVVAMVVAFETDADVGMGLSFPLRLQELNLTMEMCNS